MASRHVKHVKCFYNRQNNFLWFFLIQFVQHCQKVSSVLMCIVNLWRSTKCMHMLCPHMNYIFYKLGQKTKVAWSGNFWWLLKNNLMFYYMLLMYKYTANKCFDCFSLSLSLSLWFTTSICNSNNSVI